MREIDRIVADLRQRRPWNNGTSQTDETPAGGEPSFQSRRNSGDRATGRVEPPVRSTPLASARATPPASELAERRPPDYTTDRLTLADGAVQPEVTGELSAALVAARSRAKGGGSPLGETEAENRAAADAPPIPPELAGRIDPEAYAVAAARAEKVFEGKVGAPEAEAERMTARLSEAIETQKAEEAQRIATAQAQRAALVAERNASVAAAPEADGEDIAFPEAPEAVTQQKRSIWRDAGAAAIARGGSLATGAAAVVRAVPGKAKQVAAMTGETLKNARDGAVSATKFVKNGAEAPQDAPEAEGAAAMTVKTSDRRFGPWLTGIGALASLIFVIGVSVWTYKLGQRDAMEVPIIQAMAGDARIRPQDAGGEQVAHQGLSVNEVLNGGGATDVADVVITAPRIRTIRPEDKPASELQALIVTPEAREESPAETEDKVVGTTPELRPEVPEDKAEQVANAPEAKFVQPPKTDVAALAPETAPVVQEDASVVPQPRETELAEAPEVEVAVEPQADLQVAEATAGQEATLPVPAAPVAGQPAVGLAAPVPAEGTSSAGVQIAMLPSPPEGQGSRIAPVWAAPARTRPADVSQAMAQAVDEALAAVINDAAASSVSAPEPAATVVAAATQDAPDTIPLPAGTRMIQLGAFDSAETARSEWDRFQRQHGDLLGSKERYIQRIDNSGRIFYRLRVAGYQTREDTRAACAALSARGLPCITVTLR